jgi:hypothetical protein
MFVFTLTVCTPEDSQVIIEVLIPSSASDAVEAVYLLPSRCSEWSLYSASCFPIRHNVALRPLAHKSPQSVQMPALIKQFRGRTLSFLMFRRM